MTKIPLVIVGKPGTGKSLSTQIIYNSMKGKYSKNEYKKDDLESIYMILFDNLDLDEKGRTNPLDILNHKLENDGKNEGICFVGISNYSLDAIKANRSLSLSIPNLEDKLDQLRATSESIVRSISEDISELLIFKIFQELIIYINII